MEIKIDYKDGSFSLRDRRALEELGVSMGGENPYINIIDNTYDTVTLYCPNEQRKLFWNGAKAHFECLDCGYVPPDPRLEQIKKEQALETKMMREQHPSVNNPKRIRTRGGKIATGDRYNVAVSDSMNDDGDEDTGSPMEIRPVLTGRQGLRRSPEEPPSAYSSRDNNSELTLDHDEREMLRKGYVFKNREVITGRKNIVDTADKIQELRRRLSRDRTRSFYEQQ